MRFEPTVVLLSILLSAGRNFAPVWGNDCVNNLFDITQAQKDDEANNDIDKQRTFVLCPNTTHTVNRTEDLSIFLPNTHVKCGEDGKLSNKCIIEGGYRHIHMTKSPFTEMVRSLDDVVISGLTFTKAEGLSQCIIEVPGDIQFENCHWIDNPKYYNIEVLPLLKPEENKRVKLEIVDSIFEKNVGGKGIFFNSVEGVLQAHAKVDLSVKNCEFSNNIYPGGEYTSLIKLNGGSLEVLNCCFRNNQARHAMIATLAIMKPSSIIMTNATFVNNFGQNNEVTENWPEEQCGDILTEKRWRNGGVSEGQAFDASVCPLDSKAPRNNDDASKVICYKWGDPSPSPTVAPTTVAPTTASPTVAPTDPSSGNLVGGCIASLLVFAFSSALLLT